ncbi:hypothetical protein ACFS07_04390 [Undibacterium arcticum]
MRMAKKKRRGRKKAVAATGKKTMSAYQPTSSQWIILLCKNG